MRTEDDRLRFAPNNQRVHPLDTFDTPASALVMKASEADLHCARWLLAKRLAGHSCKVQWAKAQALIRDSADATEDERVALRDFFTELDGLEIAQVMRAAGVTPRRMAALFHEIDVRQWQAVLWVNQFSSRPHTPEMGYWDKFALGSLGFVDGKPSPVHSLGALGQALDIMPRQRHYGGRMNLTPRQQQAVNYGGKNLQLIACAGSGKTEVVAQRVAHLLTRRRSRLEPRNIVAFTFTNKAAAELKERITLRTKEALGDKVLTGMADMYVGTIHGFCQELLKVEVPKYLKYEPLDAVRQKLYVDRNCRQTGLTLCLAMNGRRLRRYIDSDRYISALNALREDEINIKALRDCSISDNGLPGYQTKLDDDGYLDFSAMLQIAVDEIKRSNPLRERLSERIKYVIVDEYQDVNPIQESLIRILSDCGAGLCVVGDDDQTIYQWRGSAVSNIISFGDRYSNVRQIRLEDNFRSSKGIIDVASSFIENIEGRLPKSMKHGGGPKYEPGDIVALPFKDPMAEATYIAKTIKSMRGVAFSENGKERGLSWSDMAVLLRSVKNNGPVIARALRKARIPFIVSGIANLFEAAEALAARALFHYIANAEIKQIEPPTKAALHKAWESARLGTKPRDLKRALSYAQDVRTKVADDSANAPSIQSVFLKFLEFLGLREEAVDDKRGEAAFFNLGRFSEVITDWESIHFTDDAGSSYSGFVAFLHYDGDDAYSEGWQDSSYMTPDAVQIMTVHQAKGREWPVVFLPALLRNRFPSQSRKSQIWQLLPRDAIVNANRYDGSVDDERRLFYVAMTRSKKFLHMTWGPIASNQLFRQKSLFCDKVIASRFVKRRPPSYSERKRADIQAKMTIANVEFTFSDLKYMFECPYQFKLRVLYGFNMPIERPLGYGKSLHDALADVHYRAMRGETVSVADVSDLVQRHLKVPYAFGELRERLTKAAHRDIRNYIEDNASRFGDIEFVEQNVEVNLGDGVSVKGRIDLVRRRDSEEVTIVDLKSNERSQAEDVTEHQLHTYALGYEELTGREADYVEIYELREREPKRRPVDEDFCTSVRKKTMKAAKSLRKMRLKKRPSMERCAQCDFSKICSASVV